MNNLSKLAIGLASMAAVAVSTPAFAAVLFSDNFEGEAAALNTTLDNWTITNGTIDVIASGSFGINCNGPTSTRCVDLDGSTSNAGRIESTGLNLTAGTYSLSFDLSGNQRGGADDTVAVLFGTTALATITLAPNAAFSAYTYLFNIVAPTSGSIIFDHAGGDNIGLILDNVQLTSIGVPEPMTLSLLGAGLFGLGMARRRRG